MTTLMGLVLCMSAFAYGRPTLNLSYEDAGERVMFRGAGLCDSDTFRIRVIDSLNGDSGWYVSGSGKTEWNVDRKKNGDCGFNFQLSKKVLVPGYVLQAVTYANGRRTHQMSKALPCELSPARLVLVFNGDFEFDVVLEQPMSCGSTGGRDPFPRREPSYPRPQPMPEEPQQNCSSTVFTTSPTDVAVNVSCRLPDYVSVRLLDTQGLVLCGNVSFQAGVTPARACTASVRNPNVRLPYRLEVMTTKREYFNTSGMIVKDASFNAKPFGEYLMGTNLSPGAKDKNFGRGEYWDVSISAKVQDADVDASENQALIKVELIDLSNGKAIRSAMVNTGRTVQFDLEHEHVKPIFGKRKHTGDLSMGSNQLVVRIWDAYNGGTYVDLPVVNVNIN